MHLLGARRPLHERVDPADRERARDWRAANKESVNEAHAAFTRILIIERQILAERREGLLRLAGWRVAPVPAPDIAMIEFPDDAMWGEVQIDAAADLLTHPPSGSRWLAVRELPPEPKSAPPFQPQPATLAPQQDDPLSALDATEEAPAEVVLVPRPTEELEQTLRKAAPGLAAPPTTPTPREFVEAYLARPGGHSIRGLLRARHDDGLDGTDGFGRQKLAAWWPKGRGKNRGGAGSKG